MKCLSLWQPWATLFAAGLKKVETRHWELKYRGPLLIHAAKSWNRNLADLSQTQPYKGLLTQLGVMWSDQGRPTIPFGQIVGKVEIVNCIPTVKVADEPIEGFDWQMKTGNGLRTLRISTVERELGDYRPGRFAFLAAHSILFKTPVDYRGFQGLFDVPREIIPELASGVMPS